MSISYSVRNILDPGFWHRPRQGAADKLLYVAARLWLDADGARLYDHDADQSVAQSIILADPEACAALRAALPEPGDYLGDVLILAHLGLKRDVLELHTAYWIVLGELTKKDTVWHQGQEIAVRPAPPGYAASQRTR